MSTATVAPAVADAATLSPSTATDPIARDDKRIAAEAALTELELAVRALWHRFFAPTEDPRPLRRRSRRSAWFPSDWP